MTDPETKHQNHTEVGVRFSDVIERFATAQQHDEPFQEQLRELRAQITKFMLPYRFAIDEVTTKLNIFKEEFAELDLYNPIEHISSRLKSPESLIEKIQRRGISGDPDEIRREITDIAGVRVVCSFITDVYHVLELLMQHDDITVVQVKDYIANPKSTGYRSLHVLLEIPVYLSDGNHMTTVEVQIRTIAMDFWASLEHKIYYKYDREVPESLLAGLRDAAESAGDLDNRMEWLHLAIRGADRGTKIRRSSDAMQALERYREERALRTGAIPAVKSESEA
ncbi:GTP pyrophosphokinase family protein [Leucobacter sp. OH1287]|uniref:GTP pyrophosphokinase n=1 Tax=Leucobacter sp. OH1287 TaxID=2491049 RepID=UPI0026B7E78E